MKEEIEEIIMKNLPAQVGETLKKTLQKAEQDEKLVKNLNEKLSEKNAYIKDLENLIEDYKAFDGRNSELEEREKSVSEQERNLKITTLEYQLESEKQKTEFTKNVALGLVRNTECRKHIFDSENQTPYQNDNGNYIYPTPINKSLTETKKEE